MMHNRSQPCRRFALCAAGVLCVLGANFAAEQSEETWQVQENLVMRLSKEWYNIGLLNRELANITDVLADIRNLEIFPEGVTNLTEDALVEFDKEIERLEKRRRVVGEKVNAFKSPLGDAVGIVREMVAGDPVQEMFDVIEFGDVERLADMIDAKHLIDSLWIDVDRLLSVAMTRMEIIPPPKPASVGGFDEEFFRIIQSNLGQLSQQYFQKLSVIKDSLVKRGNESQVDEMYLLELHLVRQYLTASRGALASQKLLDLKQRYTSPTYRKELSALLSQAHFIQEDYRKSLEVLAEADSSYLQKEGLSFRVQSWYLLGDHETVWEWAESIDFAQLDRRQRNLLLWLSMESGLALGKLERLPHFASQADQDAPYILHVMHALARSFAALDDWPTVISVLDRALSFAPETPEDEAAYRRILLAKAQTHFEMNDHEGALGLFFELLNSEQEFEEALYGIVWCYIGLGKYEKAETSLRKLINQSPQSPRAVEAILILAKRTLRKAGYEWRRATYLEREEQRLGQFLARLQRNAQLDTAEALTREAAKGLEEMRAMLQRVQSEPRLDPTAIAAFYERAVGMCDLVRDHYEAGSFQEATFTEKREKLLHQLDFLLLAIQAGAGDGGSSALATTGAQESIRKIKAIVHGSNLLRLDILLGRYRWEKEHLDWQKEAIKFDRQDLARRRNETTDSAALARIEEEETVLSSRMDFLLRTEGRLHSQRRKEVVEICTRALSSPLPEQDEAYVRYHLGETYYTQENDVFRRSYAKYERELYRYDSLLTAFREAKLLEMPQEPAPPALTHSASMKQYRTVLERFPGSAMVPAVRYSLAWCFSDRGQQDSAVAQMEAVATRYPRSPYTPQAWMYMGEFSFDNAQLDKAVKAYQQVMKYPESQWFDEALYKFAWTHYRLSNPEKAISSFLALVDLGQNEMGGQGLLDKESMDYIAISFSEADMTGEKGLSRAAEFVRRFGDANKGTRILHRLATVYKEQGRYDMSERAFKTLLRMFPGHRNSPSAEKELLAVRERRQTPADALTSKMGYFRKYNRKGKWARSQLDSVAVAMGDSLAQLVLYDAAIRHHQLALQGNDIPMYAKTAKTYREFIRNYPKSPHANECHYNLAEIMFSVGYYDRAAEEYMAVSKRYPGSKYQETAAWNAIVASRNLLKQEAEQGK